MRVESKIKKSFTKSLDAKATTKYLCIHGHFYQPPRENPWTEDIELQPSAAPYHDWNERINHESYKPNSIARVLDNQGFIVDIVNNYEKMSFNFGPTLMSWLEKKDPDTYKRIIEANHKSIATHNGHGNAIAQAYNHMILPLANRRDKTTQVKWGIADFKKRFEVNPESIWLPETACNEETLEVLVEEGIKFIILEPHQAQAISSLGSEEWQNVSHGNINPKHPYRCFLKKDPKKFIDIFFYDGSISRAVGFENVLANAQNLMGKINSAVINEEQTSQLISISTDGETYGHHKAFADRVLAYILNVEAPENGFKVTNYAEFLAENPPKYMVQLKEGDNGEGTSWSCEHGAKRWKEHCGCRGDGPAEWNQYWRSGLRHALDYLRDQLAIIFEKEGAKYFKDPWLTRNQYIEVVLDRSQENTLEFLKKLCKKELSKEEQIYCMKLLEMQRYTMLMYTSCAWFFTELSGIETVQVIQYAARAIELAKSFSKQKDCKFEEEFLRILSDAKSNVPELQDGKYIYENIAKGSVITLEKVAAHYAIMSSFDKLGEDFDITNFRVRFLNPRQESFGNHTLSTGRIIISSKTTLEEEDFAYIVLQFGAFDFRCSLKPYAELNNEFGDPLLLGKDLFEMLYQSHIVELLRRIDYYLGEEYYSLQGLFKEERSKIISSLSKEALEKVSHMYEAAYEENKRISEFYSSQKIPVPKEMKFISEFAINKKFKEEIFKLAQTGFSTKKIKSLMELMALAKLSNVHLDKEETRKSLSQELETRIRLITQNSDHKAILECLNISKIASKLNIELNIDEPQVILFNFLKKALNGKAHVNKMIMDDLNQLAKNLKINVSAIKNK